MSPGVYTREKNLSEVVPNIADSSAALVGYSTKGSIDEIVLVTTTQQFIDEYGMPSPSIGSYFHYSALAYLAQGNKLYCLRVANGALYGGVNVIVNTSAEQISPLLVGQAQPVYMNLSADADVLFKVFAKNPGTWNNKLGIKIKNVKTGAEAEPTERHTFVIEVSAQNNDDWWEVVEEWKVSRKQQLDGFGKQLYMEDKINNTSRYIYVADSAMADTALPQANSELVVMGGGANGSRPTTGQLVTGWSMFANPDDIDIRMLINGGETEIAVQTEMKRIAEKRADCVAILDMPYDKIHSVTDMVVWRNTVQNFNSSYCALYSPWIQDYDRYNDLLIELPPSGYIAAQYALTDYIGNPWDAPAGFERGMLDIIGVTRVFEEGERDVLYENQINPIQMFRGEGNVIWGHKTQQVKHSATSRVNVRRLLIVIEKAVAVTLRQFLFQPQTELTRFRVESILSQYLDMLQAQGAFQTEYGPGYMVLCNETNNTAQVIDNNELRVDVFIKPVRVVDYIRLQTIITTTGAQFTELIARGAMQ